MADDKPPRQSADLQARAPPLRLAGLAPRTDPVRHRGREAASSARPGPRRRPAEARRRMAQEVKKTAEAMSNT